MTQVEALIEDLDFVLAQSDLDTAEKATILLDRGWTKARKVVALTSGTPVEVLYRGDWVPGRVTSVGPGGLLDIAHERGSLSAYAKGSLVRLPQN